MTRCSNRDGNRAWVAADWHQGGPDGGALAAGITPSFPGNVDVSDGGTAHSAPGVAIPATKGHPRQNKRLHASDKKLDEMGRIKVKNCHGC
jgi:hypothetical protein